MFNNICINSKLRPNDQIDVAFLIDLMIYYGEVNVLVCENQMEALLRTFGVDLLAELIQMKRIKIHVRQNMFGAAMPPKGNSIPLYACGFFSKEGDNVEGILYRAHRKICNNSAKNNMFADRFTPIISSFKNESVIEDHVMEDMKNKEYFSKATLEFLKQNYPEYRQNENIVIEIEQVDPFPGFLLPSFHIHSNLNMNKLAEINKNKGFKEDFNYSSLILALGLSRSDNYTSAKFESELITDQNYSNLIALQLNDCLSRGLKSQKQIELFQESILYECPKLGDAFIAKAISSRTLKQLLAEGDKFRKWVNSVPENANLIKEYTKALTEKTLADNKLIKGVRVCMSALIGAVPGLGKILGPLASTADAYYGDKLLSGWKPNHYIQDKLEQTLKQDSKYH